MLTNKLKELGFVILDVDLGVLINYILNTIITTHIDDLLIFGPNINDINNLKSKLNEVFEVTDLRSVKYYLGIKIIRDRYNKILKLN
jgi:ribosome maturation factor RimP